MHTIILGGGYLGSAIATAAASRGERVSTYGRPASGRHDPATFADADLVVDATRGAQVRANVEVALEAGVRRFVIATTGWADDQPTVERDLRDAGAAAVASANFSIGVAIFLRLAETAAGLFGSVGGFDPFLVEWHRRAKADRPSGTALELAHRLADGRRNLAPEHELEIVSIRAGASPGMHLVGFDAEGETVELRLTARDRSAYATGALAATDWLRAATRTAGLHPFDAVVDDLLTRPGAMAA